MKVFIISYNRLTLLRNMCEWLNKKGCTPIIIDNGSTYPPLIEWFEDCPYKVHRMTDKDNHQVLWNSGIIDEYPDRYYCVTDHDLDFTGIPSDFLEVLMIGLNLFPQVVKSGFSLRISDLPDNAYTKEVRDWELKFWGDMQKGYYVADIDTTFALYDKTKGFGKLPNNKFFSAVRSAEPYTATHIPWHNTLENMSDEEKYYQEKTHTYWSTKMKELL